MTTPELIQFVKNELAVGSTRGIISAKLKLQGWTDLDIIEVFNIVNPIASPIHSEVQIESFNPVSPIDTMNSHISQEPKKWKKFIKIFIIILIPILLVIGGLFIYASGYFLNSSNLFSNIKDIL